ncbi:CpaD family pilus assembly lipoprotein [Vibrio sp. Isolate24]|uniref:CpaD family pilus assembly lipoprotein n=1 Tax=Vibrio sp. Isolate24 TaxID=2908534 RepID=UPI001EFC5702|nr:CpaD family pilus assembly lipoprotein [Vibrio sp. Isolate24]MCG9676745.1 CpaD family pilus assembly protein [Vibrio sp. Isolate24]
MKLQSLLLPVLLVLSGCASDQIARQPAIDVVSVTNKLTLAVEKKSLTPQQQQDIRSFIVQRGNPYSLRVKLVSYSPKGQSQVKPISDLLLGQGLAKHQIMTECATGTQSGDVQVIVESFRAKVPGCGTDKSQPVIFNQYKTHQAYGCSNAAALAQMVANPKDLVVGEKLGPTNGAKAVAAIDAYVAPASTNENSQDNGSVISISTGGN